MYPGERSPVLHLKIDQYLGNNLMTITIFTDQYFLLQRDLKHFLYNFHGVYIRFCLLCHFFAYRSEDVRIDFVLWYFDCVSVIPHSFNFSHLAWGVRAIPYDLNTLFPFPLCIFERGRVCDIPRPRTCAKVDFI